MHVIQRKIEHAGFGPVPTSHWLGNGKAEMQRSPFHEGSRPGHGGWRFLLNSGQVTVQEEPMTLGFS
jgi:hypothetical protein